MSPEVTGVLLALSAGLCTTIGGAMVFFVTNFQRLPLAVCMAISSGVMVYVSFVEIFAESKSSIHEGLIINWNTSKDDKNTESFAYLFSTLCFFGGWWLATIVDCLIELMISKFNLEGTANIEQPETEELIRTTDDHQGEVVGIELGELNNDKDQNRIHERMKDDIGEIECGVKELKSTEQTAESSTPTEAPLVRECSELDQSRRNSKVLKEQECWLTSFLQWNPLRCLYADKPARSESKVWEIAHAEECFHRDTRKFLRMGVFTGLALTLHNLPEGVATFTGALASDKLGASIAVAIGIHNIPEGFAVSVPLYFGTGKKWSSFFYSVITGLAEPLGALLAWAILRSSTEPLALGIAFGIVCGIMTNIALKELLPSAFKYDPCNQVTTKCFVGGMFIMAFSLILFEFK